MDIKNPIYSEVVYYSNSNNSARILLLSPNGAHISKEFVWTNDFIY